MKSVFILFKKYYPILIGAAGGYAYYYFIGCVSGTCPITGNPYISTAYGAMIGVFLAFGKSPNKNKS